MNKINFTRHLDRLAQALAWLAGLLPDRWYVVSVFGLATLCADEDDARRVERECNILYPRHAPHRAVLMGDVSAERERCAQIVEACRVPVGNSAAGEMAAEWTMDALREIRDAIRGA